MSQRRILVTGAAGFIGAALCKKLLANNKDVIGLDNLNSYYSKKLKYERLNYINRNNSGSGEWKFHEISIEENEKLKEVFEYYKPDVVVHLAAQAGVRYSLINPNSYTITNLLGFGNVLEACKDFEINNFIYASSSSVYGGNKKMPFNEEHEVNNPLSLYAATKKANELMAHSYSHLYGLPSTGLRFFTVYGPWGRPDMAPMIFADCIVNKKPIKVFNHGNMMRDFTFIDDIVEGLFRCSEKPAIKSEVFDPNQKNHYLSSAPHMIFNIGNGKAIKLMRFIELLENYFGTKAIKNFESMQPGDVQETLADTTKLHEWIGYAPTTQLEVGLSKFVKWYKEYFLIK